jgi:hypothetical protein
VYCVVSENWRGIEQHDPPPLENWTAFDALTLESRHGKINVMPQTLKLAEVRAVTFTFLWKEPTPEIPEITGPRK